MRSLAVGMVHSLAEVARHEKQIGDSCGAADARSDGDSLYALAIFSNATGSLIAISASILRFSSTPPL